MKLQVSDQSSASATGNPRNKTALKPGRSLMDWVRLSQSGADLSGTRGKKFEVTLDELQEHNHLADIWMAIKGVVYNVTPYVEYHPGGPEELMRAAGKDATDLFNEVHRWVNVESMLSKCVVGKLVPSFVKPALPPSVGRTKQVAATSSVVEGPAVPQTAPERPILHIIPQNQTEIPPRQPLPTFDWFQTPDIISLCVYTRTRNLHLCNITLNITPENFTAYVKTASGIFVVNLKLHHSVVPKCCPKVLSKTGKVEFLLSKCQKQLWPSCGTPQDNHCHIVTEHISHKAKLICRTRMTHNTWQITFQLPDCSWIYVPVGGHLTLGLPSENKTVKAKYTPVVPSLVDENNLVPDSENKVHFIVKIYPNGLFTPKLSELNLEDEVLVSSPESAFEVGKLDICRRLVCLAAGTGITPMVRLIKEALRKDRDCKVDLHFWNRTEKDILLHQEFSDLALSNTRFSVEYVLTTPSENWNGSKGRVSLEYLKSRLDSNGAMSNSQLVCICGPTEYTSTCLKLLNELGYPESAVHAFLG